jgi:hypothetical protein
MRYPWPAGRAPRAAPRQPRRGRSSSSVIALLIVAIAGAAGGIWALRHGDPKGWFQDLLPELIGFLLGSIVTYLIIDRLIDSRRRRIWRAVEGQLLYDQALYSARVLDVLMERYSSQSAPSHASDIKCERYRKIDEPAGAIDPMNVAAMVLETDEIDSYVDAVKVILDWPRVATQPKSQEYDSAVEALRDLLKPGFDEGLQDLRHLLEVVPNLDLIVRIADEPTIARRALEAQAAIAELRENLFFGDDDPVNYAQMSQVCRALKEGTENAEDLRLLRTVRLELMDAYAAAHLVCRLALTIGKHRSIWTRDERWRRIPEQR